LIVRLEDVFGKQKKVKQQWFSSDKNRFVGNRTSEKKTVKVAKIKLRIGSNFVSFIFAQSKF